MKVLEDKIIDQLLVEKQALNRQQVKSVLTLLDEGNTIPFIARYRKDQTGSLDEVQIKEIADRTSYLSNLEKRKKEVMASIEDQGKLTDKLQQAIQEANQLQQIEDLYRPYKQKRRTKATIAKEQGLEGLAQWLLEFSSKSPEEEARDYITEEVETVQAALNGAHEIIAEYISDDANYRKRLRDYTYYNAKLTSVLKDKEKDPKQVYEMYYEYQEDFRRVANHRVLALNRGEKEGVLTVSLEVDKERAYSYLFKQVIPEGSNSPVVDLVKEAIRDSYQRFIKPSIERELRSQLTERAETQAIEVFGENLRNLLLQAPLKDKIVMGFDPAYRTGCKLAVVDSTGKVLAIKVIYPHTTGDTKRQQAKEQLSALIQDYDVDTVAIGNGTASRESEVFVAEVLKDIDRSVAYVIVNEAGASVYSASEEARREFPDLQVEERSAVSIARRLQDPLAELVKIDPESIGVGQYQHDVSQKKLAQELNFVVETAVNQVGVNVNTASVALLKHISGLTKTTAENVVKFREENGRFANRQQLKSVKRLGPKAYEQSVGFLRIPDGEEILDRTSIHPESYTEAKELLEVIGSNEEELGSQEIKEKIKAMDTEEFLEKSGLGVETYQDIAQSLALPTRDMRDDMTQPLLRTDVLELKDLKPGMKMEGTVRNVVDFGAFVDIGVKQDGLVHISKMSEKFVSHPKEILAVGDIVEVWISSVDLAKERIGLTMLAPVEN